MKRKAGSDSSTSARVFLAADEITVGMIVRLASGGPTMTVIRVLGDRILCYWFTAAGERRSGWFPPETLVEV